MIFEARVRVGNKHKSTRRREAAAQVVGSTDTVVGKVWLAGAVNRRFEIGVADRGLERDLGHHFLRP